MNDAGMRTVPSGLRRMRSLAEMARRASPHSALAQLNDQVDARPTTGLFKVWLPVEP